MDDMTIKALGVGGGQAAGAVRGDTQGAGGAFLGSLKDAIAQVNEVQLAASQTVDQFAAGEHQNVHQMMIALQKADISFQLMMQVRNKLIAAYEDIQRMQV